MRMGDGGAPPSRLWTTCYGTNFLAMSNTSTVGDCLHQHNSCGVSRQDTRVVSRSIVMRAEDITLASLPCTTVSHDLALVDYYKIPIRPTFATVT